MSAQLTPSEAAERVVPSAEEVAGQLARIGDRLHGSLRRQAMLGRQRLEAIANRRPFAHPHAPIDDRARELDELDARARRAASGIATVGKHRVATLAGKLESLSPLAVLGRGYSVTREAKTGKVIRSSGQLKAGQEIVTRFHQGQAISVVQDVEV